MVLSPWLTQRLEPILLWLVSLGVHGVFLVWIRRWTRPGSRARWVLLAALASGAALAPVGRLFVLRSPSVLTTRLFILGLFEIVYLGLMAAPLGALLVLVKAHEWHVSRRPASVSPPASPPDPPGNESPALTRRGILEQSASACIFAGGTALVGWGWARGRLDLRVEEVVVPIRGLPRVLEGYTLVQLSDIHAGELLSQHLLLEGLEKVRRLRPDIVVVTGDLVDFEAANARPLGRLLGDLEPRDGVFAIMGNHDHYAGATAVRGYLAQAGIRVLYNQGTLLRPRDGGGIALLGVDDLSGPRDGGPGQDFPKALADVPKDRPRILLAHQPSTFASHQGSVALQLSGHLHGGQINPGVHPLSLITRYIAGRYEAKGSVLWVNRGFGTSGPPLRLNAPAEVTKIVLVEG